MAKDLIVNGIVYNGVESLSVKENNSSEYVLFNDTSSADATASDILGGKSAWVDGEKVTGNIPSKTAQVFTPGVEDQIIEEGNYLAGEQKILGDANLIADNIKKDVSIFGVNGAFEGSGGGNLQSATLWKWGENYPEEGYDGFSSVEIKTYNTRCYTVYYDPDSGLNAPAGFSRYFELKWDADNEKHYLNPLRDVVINGPKWNRMVFKTVAKKVSGVCTPILDSSYYKVDMTNGFPADKTIYLANFSNYSASGIWFAFFTN